MFTLIVTGVGAAYLYSLFTVLFPSLRPDNLKVDGYVEVFFDTSTVIVRLALFGQTLQLFAGQEAITAKIVSVQPAAVLQSA